MSRIAIAVFAALVTSCQAPVSTEKPRSPSDVVHQPVRGERVSWVGKIESFEATREGSEAVLEWVCSHLATQSPLSPELESTPIPVVGRGSGLFLVNLVTDMPHGDVESLAAETAETPHYMWASGTVDSVVTREGRRVVFLFTEKMKLGQDLVSFAGP